jgi:hypothetical protein
VIPAGGGRYALERGVLEKIEPCPGGGGNGGGGGGSGAERGGMEGAGAQPVGRGKLASEHSLEHFCVTCQTRPKDADEADGPLIALLCGHVGHVHCMVRCAVHATKAARGAPSLPSHTVWTCPYCKAPTTVVHGAYDVIAQHEVPVKTPRGTPDGSPTPS